MTYIPSTTSDKRLPYLYSKKSGAGINGDFAAAGSMFFRANAAAAQGDLSDSPPSLIGMAQSVMPMRFLPEIRGNQGKKSFPGRKAKVDINGEFGIIKSRNWKE